MEDNDRPKILTTAAGAPVPDTHQSMATGDGSQLLQQDHYLTEKLASFSRERIPERVVHAKGSAAFGSLLITSDISRLTNATFLQHEARTDVLVRFSNFSGEAGAADAERDVRGFAMKVYTNIGNWDLVGSNLPVSSVRDPAKFPELVHALKRHPVSHVRSATAMWDFWSLTPESMHQILMLFSDRGLPKSYRHMNGYGGHAFGLINQAGDHVWVKFHFKTLQGILNNTPNQARELIADDRESFQRDLFEAVDRGDHPRWSFCIQVMSDAEAQQLPFDPFDLTRVWPQSKFPLVEVGVLSLDRNPDNYFAQVEQATFSPSNIVPGICFSPDKMLQARLLAYPDAHRHRIGTHYAALAVNRPICPVHTYYADGAMRYDVPNKTDAYYQPNSFGGPIPDRGVPGPLTGTSSTTGRIADAQASDDYGQAAALLRLMSVSQRASLIDAISASLVLVPEVIQRRQIAHFKLVDPSFGDGILARMPLRHE
jgi:catalase